MNKTYKAGDEVTIRLTSYTAAQINKVDYVILANRDIISHTPKRDLLDEMEAEMNRSNTPCVYAIIRMIIQHLREKESTND